VTENPPLAQNRLEQLLEQAAQGDADAQERFGNALLNGDLYVVGHVEGAAERVDGNYATVDPSQLRIPTTQFGGETVLAAFTSPVRLEAATGGELPYVGLRGRALLAGRQRGLKVVINGGVWHGIELSSQEVDRMLNEGIVEVPPGTDVMLGLAADRPDALVAQLREWLCTRPDVVSARLAQIFDETSGQPPHPLVGLEFVECGQMESVFASAPPFDRPVDLVPLLDHPLGDWLQQNGEEIYRA
jgi:hypothetical protein